MNNVRDISRIAQPAVIAAFDQLRAEIAEVWPPPPDILDALGPDPGQAQARLALHALARIVLLRRWSAAGWPVAVDGRALIGALERLQTLAPHIAGTASDYAWFMPSPAAALMTWESLPAIPGDIDNNDILGDMFQRITLSPARKSHGQFFTPVPLIRFIWDRTGLGSAPDGGLPEVFDPCTGSGPFLREAVARMIERLGASGERGPSASPAKALRSVLDHVHGVDVDPFACQLAAINVLLAVAPLAAAAAMAGEQLPPLHIDITAGDALALGTVTLDAQPGLWEIASPEGFVRADVICANPPYIGEKGNRALFRRVLDRWPVWNRYYSARMDYFYWFIILALSKLKPGGRMGFITTSYWPTADGAAPLRQFILDYARIIEMIDFTDVPMFSDALGQHSLVFVLERCPEPERRHRHAPRTVRIQAGDFKRYDDNMLQEMLGAVGGALDRVATDCEFVSGPFSIIVRQAPTVQRQLTSGPWHLYVSGQDETLLASIAAAGTPLSDVLRDIQGVITGADKVTPASLALLSTAVVQREAISSGQGIFCLSARELEALHLHDEERTFVKRTFRNRQVGFYTVEISAGEHEYLLYLTRGAPFSPARTPNLFRHLERFRPILEAKRETQLINHRTGLPLRFWHELHWPRDEELLAGESLVTSRRGPVNCFAYENSGLYENSDLTVLALRPGIREDLRYFLALLNSSLLDFWYARRSKRKGRQREYYATPLQHIPLRRIDWRRTSVRRRQQTVRKVRQVVQHLDARSTADTLRSILAAGDEPAVHDALVALVEAAVTIQRQLELLSPLVGRKLTRVPPWEPLRSSGKMPALTSELLAKIIPLRNQLRAVQQTIDETVLDLYGIVDLDQRALASRRCTPAECPRPGSE